MRSQGQSEAYDFLVFAVQRNRAVPEGELERVSRRGHERLGVHADHTRKYSRFYADKSVQVSWIRLVIIDFYSCQQNVGKEQHDQLVVMCSAVNEAGSDEWRATLTVTAAAYEESLPPIIEYGPANQTLPYSSIGMLVCKAMGNPQPVITWYKDDSPLSTTENTRINITETGTLQITSELAREKVT